jgi:hypothetical protein
MPQIAGRYASRGWMLSGGSWLAPDYTGFRKLSPESHGTHR